MVRRTERTLINKAAVDKKMGRYTRVIIAAAKQSGALFLPKIHDAIFFKEILTKLNRYDLCLFPNLSKKPLSLKDAASGFTKGSILILIGPEGDFSESEIDAAIKNGCIGVSLGSSVLRVDTAAIGCLSFLRLHFGL